MSGSNLTLLLSARHYFGMRRARKSEAMRGYCDCSSIFLLPIVLATVSAQFLYEVHAENCERGPATMARYYFVDDWLYQLIVVGPTGMRTSIETQHFMQSFRVIG